MWHLCIVFKCFHSFKCPGWEGQGYLKHYKGIYIHKELVQVTQWGFYEKEICLIGANAVYMVTFTVFTSVNAVEYLGRKD